MRICLAPARFQSIFIYLTRTLPPQGQKLLPAAGRDQGHVLFKGSDATSSAVTSKTSTFQVNPHRLQQPLVHDPHARLQGHYSNALHQQGSTSRTGRTTAAAAAHDSDANSVPMTPSEVNAAQDARGKGAALPKSPPQAVPPGPQLHPDKSGPVSGAGAQSAAVKRAGSSTSGVDSAPQMLTWTRYNPSIRWRFVPFPLISQFPLAVLDAHHSRELMHDSVIDTSL